jgi:hypothetical protein
VPLVSTTAELALAELDAFETREQLIDELIARASDVLSVEGVRWRSVEGRGTGNSETKRVTIPRWAGDPGFWQVQYRSRLYLAYYVVHEVAHVVPGSWGRHDAAYKRHEARALREVLGVTIKRARVYPNALLDAETGAELYVAPRVVRRRVAAGESR